eukprot:4649438-Alexandrium_andersonii.AAC.1
MAVQVIQAVLRQALPALGFVVPESPWQTGSAQADLLAQARQTAFEAEELVPASPVSVGAVRADIGEFDAELDSDIADEGGQLRLRQSAAEGRWGFLDAAARQMQ